MTALPDVRYWHLLGRSKLSPLFLYHDWKTYHICKKKKKSSNNTLYEERKKLIKNKRVFISDTALDFCRRYKKSNEESHRSEGGRWEHLATYWNWVISVSVGGRFVSYWIKCLKIQSLIKQWIKLNRKVLKKILFSCLWLLLFLIFWIKQVMIGLCFLFIS